MEEDFVLKRKTVSEVYEVIMKQKTSNAKGNDEITSRVIKTMPHYTATAICHLYTHIIRTGKFPDSLKIARITPILKPGKGRSEKSSYRPISNLNSIEKVIEQLIKEDLESFLDKNDVIPKEHHGGRPYHSTVTAKAIIDLEINKL